jgi:hypothetical protein
VNRHLRGYLPMYALAAVWLLTVTVFPSVHQGRGAATSDAALGEFGSPNASPLDGFASPLEGTPTAGLGVPTSGPASIRSSDRPTAPVQVGSGVTRGGIPCRPGVRQIRGSDYAAPCIGRFSGYNGGSTYRGVSDTSIRVGVRHLLNETTGEGPEHDFEIVKGLVNYFNQNYELYGRRVVLEEFQGRGNRIDELQSRGRQAACLDASTAVERDYFAVLDYSSGDTTEPFADCAADRKLFVPIGPGYMPERFFRGWHPYVWSRVVECERIGRDIGEYAGKRLLNQPARWAGSAEYRSQKRVFGLYVPDNDGFQICADLVERSLQNYGGKIKHRIDYTLDLSLLASQAVNAVVQFKREGVTTLILACDTLSTQLLTHAAEQQDWHPEWVIIGVDAQDYDNNARAFNRRQVEGHLFGLSQLGDLRRRYALDGEPARTYREATGKPLGTNAGTYFNMVDFFNMLQRAGPILTPANIAAGLRTLPTAGGPFGLDGTWSYANDHAAIEDSIEVFWDPDARSFDGELGSYRQSYGGRRFSSGEWPAEEPRIYGYSP